MTSVGRLAIVAVAVLAVVGVMTVLACGPASPAQQSGGGEADSGAAALVPGVSILPQESGGVSSDGEQPTSTRDPDCYEINHPHEDRMVEMCPPPGPKSVEPQLRGQYNEHMAAKAERQVRGEPTEPVLLEILVETSTTDAVDDVVELLNDNGARVFSWDKEGDTRVAGGVYARVNLELIFAIAEIEGVVRVQKVRPASPTGSSRQQPAPSAAAILQADQWRSAGVAVSS